MKGRRRAERQRRRLTCEMQVKGRFQRGIVLDLSSNGLFVQTASPPPPGTIVDVRLHATGAVGEVPFRARVARLQRVDPRLARLAPNGVGLELLEAPPGYLELLERRGGSPPAPARPGPAAPAPAREPEPGIPCFSVRVKQSQGSRSRKLAVAAADEDAARRAALEQAGAGWEVVEVSRWEPPPG